MEDERLKELIRTYHDLVTKIAEVQKQILDHLADMTPGSFEAVKPPIPPPQKLRQRDKPNHKT